MNRTEPQAPLRNLFEAMRLPSFATPKTGAPCTVALEGPNGVGKTTLARALRERMGASTCLGVDRAWFSDEFKIRMIRDADWFSSAMFFLSGCFEQMRALRHSSKKLVIMDRSIWSTLAVHAATDAKRLEALLEMLRPVAAEIRVPDFVLVLDASFETCQQRIAEKTGTARDLDHLTATSEFHGRERSFYEWLARQRPGIEFFNVDQATADQVADRVEKKLQQKAQSPHC